MSGADIWFRPTRDMVTVLRQTFVTPLTLVLLTVTGTVMSAASADPTRSSMVVAAAFVAPFAQLFITYWLNRKLAGPTVGIGRPWKWLGGLLGIGILAAVPVVIVIVVVGIEAVSDPTNPAFMVLGFGGAIVGALLILLQVRVTAIAISGDRYRLADVTQELRGAFAPYAITSFLLSCFVLLAYAAIDAALRSGAMTSPWISAAAQGVQSATAAVLNAGLIVGAYMRVDRSDLRSISEIFG